MCHKQDAGLISIILISTQACMAVDTAVLQSVHGMCLHVASVYIEGCVHTIIGSLIKIRDNDEVSSSHQNNKNQLSRENNVEKL